MLRLAVLVSGGGTNLQALIDRIEQKELPGVKIEVVISSSRKAFALERAKRRGIPAAAIVKKEYSSPEDYEEALIKLLNSYSVDLVVLAGFLVLLPERLVREYRNKIINIHPSLIPAFCGEGYYGLKVHEAALLRGVKISGATVHYVDEGTDTGPIILQKSVPVEQGDTPELLQRRVMEQAERVILPEAVRLIAEGRVTVKDHIVHISS